MLPKYVEHWAGEVDAVKMAEVACDHLGQRPGLTGEEKRGLLAQVCALLPLQNIHRAKQNARFASLDYKILAPRIQWNFLPNR